MSARLAASPTRGGRAGRTAGALAVLGVVLGAAALTACNRLALDDVSVGGGGPGPGPTDPGEPPPTQLGAQVSLGLTSAAAGDGVVRVDWRRPSTELDPPELALLVERPGEPSFQAPPLRLEPQVGRVLVAGLENGVLHELSLGVAPAPGAPYESVGATLRVRPGPPLYVDGATTTPGDGTTPEAPLDDPVLAVLIAFTFGGGNVWLAEGDYAGINLPMFDGVDVAGGFPADFELKGRDPLAHPTRLIGVGTLPIVAVSQGTGLATLDGVELDGLGESPAGVQVDDSSFEGRALRALRCRRGVSIQNSPGADTIEVVLVASTLQANDIDGLTGEGSLDLVLDGCALLDNQQEGLDFGLWTAPQGETVELRARGSSFARNGAEGFDIDLDAPAGGGANGGRFRVRIERCDFQSNALDGLLIDLDYEAFPAWSAEIAVRGCLARANGGAGVRLDLDSTATVLVHRLASTANAGHGLLAASESAPGMLTLSASWLAGNQLAGARAELGNYGLLLSHCGLAGNAGGGLSSPDAPGAAVSSLAHLQPEPFGAALAVGSVAQEPALPVPFVVAPREHGRALALQGDVLTLAAPPAGTPGLRLELADDGVAREVLAVDGALVTVAPAPEGAAPPLALGWFDAEQPVAEDLRLAPDSVGLGVGMAPPNGAPVDAGPFGSPAGGRPGDEQQPPAALFYLGRTTPPWTLPVPAAAELALEFLGGLPDPASLPAGLVVYGPDGQPLALDVSVQGERVLLAAPPGGWTSGTRVELNAALSSADGRPLAAPVALPLVRG